MLACSYSSVLVMQVKVNITLSDVHFEIMATTGTNIKRCIGKIGSEYSMSEPS